MIRDLSAASPVPKGKTAATDLPSSCQDEAAGHPGEPDRPDHTSGQFEFKQVVFTTISCPTYVLRRDRWRLIFDQLTGSMSASGPELFPRNLLRLNDGFRGVRRQPDTAAPRASRRLSRNCIPADVRLVGGGHAAGHGRQGAGGEPPSSRTRHGWHHCRTPRSAPRGLCRGGRSKPREIGWSS